MDDTEKPKATLNDCQTRGRSERERTDERERDDDETTAGGEAAGAGELPARPNERTTRRLPEERQPALASYQRDRTERTTKRRDDCQKRGSRRWRATSETERANDETTRRLPEERQPALERCQRDQKRANDKRRDDCQKRGSRRWRATSETERANDETTRRLPKERQPALESYQRDRTSERRKRRDDCQKRGSRRWRAASGTRSDERRGDCQRRGSRRWRATSETERANDKRRDDCQKRGSRRWRDTSGTRSDGTTGRLPEERQPALERYQREPEATDDEATARREAAGAGEIPARPNEQTTKDKTTRPLPEVRQPRGNGRADNETTRRLAAANVD